jgi:hypothetical protein
MKAVLKENNMVLIPVPKPPKSAMNPDRPVSKLLRNQMEHLQEAEFRLPAKLQTNIYINAIKTEGEAADYIRRVTQAIQGAHATQVAAEADKRKAKKRRQLLEIAAVADDRPLRKRAGRSKTKRKT